MSSFGHYYDAIETSYQLGNGLQVGVDDANLFTSPIRFGIPDDEPFNGYLDLQRQGPQCEICEHQGSLYVAFVQTKWDGSTTAHVGGSSPVTKNYFAAQTPYVKRYDVATDTWVPVGSSIEPALLEVDGDIFFVAQGYTLSTGGGVIRSSNFALGTRFLPSRVRIRSDGTHLYLAYALHITLPAGGGSVYSPFTYIIRRYNTATDTWDLFGQIDPVGQNDSLGGAFGSTALSTYSFHNIVASPNEPGVVYSSLVQSGLLGAGPGMYLGVVTRFDGSSIAGTAKVIGTPKTVTTTLPNYSLAGSTFRDLALRYDTPDGPFIYWYGNLDEATSSSNYYRVLRWSDMATLFQYGPSSFSTITTPRGYESGDVLVTMLDVNYYLREMAYDGSTPSPIDGVLPEVAERLAGNSSSDYPDFGFLGSIAPVLPDLPNDIWGIEPTGGTSVWLYHRPCRAWTEQLWTPAGGTHGPITAGFRFDPESFRHDDDVGRHYTQSFWNTDRVDGWEFDNFVSSILVDDVIYCVAWLGYEGASRVTKLWAYAAPIARDANRCGNAIHIAKRFVND